MLATAGAAGCLTLLAGTKVAAALLLPLLPVLLQRLRSQRARKAGSGEARLQLQLLQHELLRGTKLRLMAMRCL